LLQVYNTIHTQLMLSFLLLGFDKRLQTSFLPLASVLLCIGGSLLIILAFALFRHHRLKLGTQLTFCQALCDLVLGCTLLVSLPRFLEWKDLLAVILLRRVAYYTSIAYGFVMCYMIARSIYDANRFKTTKLRVGSYHVYVLASAFANSFVPPLLAYRSVDQRYFGLINKFPYSWQTHALLVGSVCLVAYAALVTTRAFRFGSSQNRLITLVARFVSVFFCFWTIPISICLIHSCPQVAFPLILGTLIAKMYMYFY